MGLFSRKQGRVATVRAMSSFTEDERERGMDMLQAAEAVFVELGAPSRLGTALFTACVGGMGVDEDSPAFGIAAGASLMGYACRMAVPGRDLPENMVGAINSQLAFTGSGEFDYEAMADDPDRFGKLLELAKAGRDAATAKAADVIVIDARDRAAGARTVRDSPSGRTGHRARWTTAGSRTSSGTTAR